MKPHTLFAMDTYFYHPLGSYPPSVRCAMLKALGYDATYHTIFDQRAWDDLPDLGAAAVEAELDIAGIFITLEIAPDMREESVRSFERLCADAPASSRIELALRASGGAIPPSSTTGLLEAERLLALLFPIASARGHQISLYIHGDFWLEKLSDSLLLCRTFRDENLGAVFCGFHWFNKDGRRLEQSLAEIAPFLRSVNLCGSRRSADGSCTIEPMDSGSLDNFAILGALHRCGYDGPVGFQGYSIGGDPFPALQRSLAAFRTMEARLDENPSWSGIRWST